MFGRLSQLAQNVQNSFNADEGEGSPSKGADNEKTIARLQADLEQAEEQNKSINAAFKKLLKEKEQEIKALKENASKGVSLGIDDTQDSKISAVDVDSFNQLKRKNEEYQMLISQKDETIQMLMANVKEAEDIREKVEQQERINTEKLMFELAERIKAHENIQRKLEETKHVMTEKDNAIHNMADQMAAQEELLKAREDSIKKLKRMAAGNETSEDMIVTLQKAVQEKDNRLSQMAQLIDKLEVEKKLLDAKINNRDGLETSKDQTIKTLWSEIEQKNEMIQKMQTEKDELNSAILKKEQEIKSKLDAIGEKDSVVNELTVKIRSLEKELNLQHSDIEVSSEGASREIGHLKDQLIEMNEILKSKTQTVDMFQKEMEEKDSAYGELRQKLVALNKIMEENDEKMQEMQRMSKKIMKERDEFKEKYENEANEKTAMKEQLDKVGSELSQQLDEEAQKVANLMNKLDESERKKNQIKEESGKLADELANCKELQTVSSTELNAEKARMKDLEKEVEEHKKESMQKSEELKKLKSDLEAKSDKLDAANEEIEAKRNEIQVQRDRFDAELNLLQSTSETEKGNSASLLQEMEQIRRELDAVNQEKEHFQRESLGFKKKIEEREAQLEEMHVNIQKTQDDNSRLKDVVSTLEGKMKDLTDLEMLNESLKAEFGKEMENLEEEKRIRSELEKECDHLKKDFEEKCSLLEGEQGNLQALQEENSSLKQEWKALEERLQMLQEEQKLVENAKEAMTKENENLNAQLHLMKNEFVELNGKVQEMEASMNHMVEKLNSAELKMNESMQEKDILEEKLKQTVEERSLLANQKTDIETALEEFVKSTESRKKRSGRSSVDGSEGARSTPNEGLSGYSTPVSKEGSPRNSAFIETFQPPLQPPSAVGNLFEGKAISEIFRLVEEERKTLEANLASVTREREALSLRNSELEDYLELEKQKFKQASEEISLMQQNIHDAENVFNQQIYDFQEALSSMRYANEDLELRIKQDAEVHESNRVNIEKLEGELRQTEDKLADKTLELTRLGESSDQMQSELGNKEEQFEKVAKQNKQMKNKLKELLKERAEREKLIGEKDSRIAELEAVSVKLNESKNEIERLEIEIKERDDKLVSLEQEKNDRMTEVSMLGAKVLELEEDARKIREMSANEVYAANEKATELERSFREVEEINDILKGDVGTKAREIEDLDSILSVHKEELASIKQLLLQKDEELAVMRNNVDTRDQKLIEQAEEIEKTTIELRTANEQLVAERSTLEESENVIKSLNMSAAEKESNILEITKELDAQKDQNSRQVEYISKLEEDMSEISNELLKTKEELAQSENANQVKKSEVGKLEEEITSLKNGITEKEEEHRRIVSENERKFLQSQDDLELKMKEIQRLTEQKESVESKVKDLEEMLVGKETGLTEIVDAKNNELKMLKGENEALNVELLDANKSVKEYQHKLAAVENDLEENTLKHKQAEERIAEQIATKDADLSKNKEEITELTEKCNEQMKLFEIAQQKLDAAEESLQKVSEMKEVIVKELEDKNEKCLLLEKTLDDVKGEKSKLIEDAGAKDLEAQKLERQLASMSEAIKNLTEELDRERRAVEEHKIVMEKSKDESGSQIENLMSKVGDLLQEKDDKLRTIDSLKSELDMQSKALHDSESRNEILVNEKENLRHELEKVYADLEEKESVLASKSKELDDSMQKASASKESVKSLLEEKNQLVEDVKSYAEKIKQLEMDKEENVSSLKEELMSKEVMATSLGDELQKLKERDGNMSKIVADFEKSFAEKDDELKEVAETLEKVRRDLEESSKEKEELDAQNERAKERCNSLGKQIEELQKEMVRTDQEFEAERDIYAAKISDLNASIELLTQKEAESRLELQRIKVEADSKDELIALKSEELEVSKSMTEKLENEEIMKLQEAVNEKSKNFEEYKVKVLKKMKSSKEEQKKLSARNKELIEKEAKLSEVESELEAQKLERQNVESMLLEVKSELETVKGERQNLMAQIDTHKQRIQEIENLNVSREENIRNFETEIARYQRLLQNKDEEVGTIKEMMQNSMEEIQTLHEGLHKKEERLRILQEQLMTNEEDFSSSFTEKENEIEGLNEKLKQFEGALREKEKLTADLGTTIREFEEKVAQSESIRHEMGAELQASKEEKQLLMGEKSQLLEKVEMLTGDVEKITAEKAVFNDEILKLRDELAIKANEVSLGKDEIDKLRDELQNITKEQMQKSDDNKQLFSSEEYQTLENEKDDLRRRLEDMMEAHKSLEGEYKEKSAEIEILMEQLEQMGNEIERLKSKPDVSFDDVIKPYVEQIGELQEDAEKKKKSVDEYKAKAAKRIKALKEENISLKSAADDLNKKLEEQETKANESLLELGRENETLNTKIVDMEKNLEEVMNNSVKECEQFESLAKANEAEAENMRSEFGRVKQRLSDKEEEIMTVKEMMKMSMSEMQTLQEELQKKEGEFKVKEDDLNSSVLSLNEELASLKEDYMLKSSEFKTIEDQLTESNKLVEVLNDTLDAKNAEFDQLQKTTAERGVDSTGEDAAISKEEQLKQLEKESEAIKLKLAKAIKKMGTMKKELQSKEELIKSLEHDNGILKSTSQELKLQNEHLETELNSAKEKIVAQDEELQQKEKCLEEVKLRHEPKIEEVITPLTMVGVAAECEDGWGESSHVESADNVDSGRFTQELVVEEVVKETGSLEVAAGYPVNDSLKDEIELLKKDKDDLSESLRKSNEQFEKAKKKIALLKKVDIKRGKEIEELKTAFDGVTNKKEEEISELAAKINDLDQKLNEKEEQTSALLLENKSLKIDLDEAVRMKEKSQAKIEDLKKLVEVMGEEKLELDDEMKEMLNEIKEVMDIKNKLLTDLKDAGEKLSRKEEEFCKLKEALIEKDGKLAANEWKLQELEALEQELMETNEEKMKLNEEIALHVKKLEELESSLEIKENDNKSLNEELSNIRELVSKKEEAISALQAEAQKKNEMLNELQNQDALAELNAKIDGLEEELRLKNDEVTKLSIANEDLQNKVNEGKATFKRLEDDTRAIQKELSSQLENQRQEAEDLKEQLRTLQEELRVSLSKIEEVKGVENLNSSLQQELNEQRVLVDGLNKAIAVKNDEMENLSLQFQEKEKEVKRLLSDEITARNFLEEEVENMKKTMNESFNDSERSMLNSAIEEMRLNSSLKEESLNEEIRLLKERLDKEKETVNEKSKIEREELVKSFEEKSHVMGELEEKIGKLNETIEHKDTVIAKLKLKLKQTIKDRDVMKGNLQSEIERLSQEKDVIFNEFQTKAQHTEGDVLTLKSEFAELEARHEEMEKELENKSKNVKELSKELDHLREEKVTVSSTISSLEGKITALEQEVEAKEEVIEKYEWENSEKEDKIRDLEREARFFEDRKAEWEELKRTFEDTIEVKEKIMGNLQKEIEENQTRKIKDSKLKEDELNEFGEKIKDLENMLKILEEKCKDAEEKLILSNKEIKEFEEERRKILDVLGGSEDDATYDKNVCDAILELKTASEKQLELKGEEARTLEGNVESLLKDKKDMEEKFNCLNDEVEMEIEKMLPLVGKEDEWIEKRSLKSIVEVMTSQIERSKKENEDLNAALISTKESECRLEKQIEEFQGRFEEDLGRLEEERKSLKASREMQSQEEIDVMNEKLLSSERECRELEEKCNDLKNELLYLKEDIEKKNEMIGKFNHEKATLEKKTSEMEHALDLAKLETQQATVDKDNLERQLKIMIEESDSLRSSALPEMQALVSAKNTAMLELRENFSEVISDKDSIISSLRAKLGEFQRNMSDGNFKSQQELDAMTVLMNQKEDHVAKLARDLANVKRSRDWLQTELSKTIQEKNNIGGSMQTQFESISKGLRGDIELFMEDKKAFETEFQLERLQLEKTIAEQRREIDDTREAIGARDEEIYELNFVVSELRRRVEDAADILSKEDYYRQLEERIEESYEKVREANATVRDLQDRLREEKHRIEELEMKVKISNRERGEVVLVYEGKMQKLQNDHAKVYQSLKSELQELNQKKLDFEVAFEKKLEEAKRNNEFAEQNLNEGFDKERMEMTRRIEDLRSQVKKLEEEKQETRKAAIDEVLTDADEKMLRLKTDYESIISDKKYRIKGFAERIEELQERLDSLTESNTNLSRNLFVFEHENANLKKEIASLSNIYQQTVANHKTEIDGLLAKKGSDFKELRSQFEEALEEKEKILENLQSRLRDLHEKMELKFQENNQLSSVKEELLQESIKKDLVYEKLKVNVDSLLSSVFEISDKTSEKRALETTNLKEGKELDGGQAVRVSDPERKFTKDGLAKEFEASISEAKLVVDSYLQSRKGLDKVEEDVNKDISRLQNELKLAKEENSRLNLALIEADGNHEKSLKQLEMDLQNLENIIKNMEDENAKLLAKIAHFDQNEAKIEVQTTKSNAKEHDESLDIKRQLSQKEAVEDVIIPTSSIELTATSKDKSTVEENTGIGLKEELASLKAENERLEQTKQEIEMGVRKDFDDILQNLREDLQNAMNENKSLMEEIFMLKNVKKGANDSIKMHDVTSQTEQDLAIDPSKHAQSHTTEGGSSTEASAQTDVSFVYQPADDSKRGSSSGEAARIKRYSSSDRLPEVVEDTLYSKMSFEQLQTFSDSTLEGEPFSGHAKLELRLGEDTEDGDRSINVADLQSEIENLNLKLQQSKKLIVKLKQMTKKYKTELGELQAEKFEQVRVYEEAINGTKQELEEICLEKVRKDQEIRSLREEVRLLVKEKADLGDAVKSRIDAIIADHSVQTTELSERNDQECAKKDEVIRMLYSMKSENESKIEQLKNQLSTALLEKENMKSLHDQTQSKLDDKNTKMIEQKEAFEKLKAAFDETDERLKESEEERSRLEAELKVEKADAMIDNPRFDEEVIESYIEDLERSNVELKEAFDLIRALENNQRELEEEFESRVDELNSIIDAHEETIERINSEKIGIQKSMQEMREEVRRTVDEKNNIVEYWKNQNGKILEENEMKFSEKIEISQRSIEECQMEIIALREQVESQNKEIESLKEQLNTAESAAKDFGEKKDNCEVIVTNLRNELERALEEKSLFEDKLTFFEHQVDGMKNEHGKEVQMHQNEVEEVNGAMEALKIAVDDRDKEIAALESEVQSLKEELGKSKKKSKRFKREMETLKKTNQELGDGVRIEMEKIVNEIQDEKAALYSEVLAKESQLQEVRIHADQLMQEREQWNSRVRTSGPVQHELLVGSADIEMGFSDKERLSLQVNQLKAEKEQVMGTLENKIIQLKSAYDDMEKKKRESDLKAAEFQAKLDHVIKQGTVKEKSKQKDELEGYGLEVKSLKGDIDMLKQEASGFAGTSQMLFGQMEKEITNLLMNAAQGHAQPIPKTVTNTETTELRSLSPDERLNDNNGDLEEAREQIAMLEDSLRTWKERCSELEEQLEQQGVISEVSGRRGSREFLINIDDEGPSIETARPAFGEKARRLMKYSTSGISLKTRARSFFSSFISKQRGMLPVRRILLMFYILAIHILAFMSLYGLMHG